MKTFNKITAILWFFLSGIAFAIALILWELLYCLLAIIFYFIGEVAWEEYKELKEKEEIYKFKK